jgi:hypothetical protein
MVRPARTLALCALAACAALLLAASPAAAQGSNRAVFTASLNPLPNTTGVNLGGNGFARVVFNTGASNAPRGDNQFKSSRSTSTTWRVYSHAASSERD